MAAGKYNLTSILFSDLDGTLIFSAARKQVGDIVIERKDGREISCITERQAELFSKLKNVIPVTTRSVEQYRRIEFARYGFSPRFTLCANGGVLLVDGKPDAEWSKWSGRIYRECEAELLKFRERLDSDPHRSFEVRLVDGLFLFTKSAEPEETLRHLGDGELCESFFTGEKVYAVPRKLSKGAAVKRLAKRLELSEFAAAGDSLMDLSMLNAADAAVFTSNIPENMVTAREKFIRPCERFSEFVTEFAGKGRV